MGLSLNGMDGVFAMQQRRGARCQDVDEEEEEQEEVEVHLGSV